MTIRKYINWNTLKGDSWIGWRFYILPSLNLRYDKNEINGEGYIKELWLSFDFLFCTFALIFSWSPHKQLL